MKRLLIPALISLTGLTSCDKGKTTTTTPDPVDPRWIALAETIESHMVQVDAGSFLCGCTAPDSLCSGLEDSLHTEEVKAFHICKYEVTNEEWMTIMGGFQAAHEICNRCPAEKMAWNDVVVFIEKLNTASGKKFRLPTGAEWEYAARGGQKKGAEPLLYAGSNNLDAVAWHVFNSGGHSHEVGQKKPNELGLYDMTGNVEEWSSDTWQYSEKKNDKLRRGGGWSGSDIYQRVFVPRWSEAEYPVEGCGFRLVMD
jgi:formylglycine-generating enzyme required for sulfatase activity